MGKTIKNSFGALAAAFLLSGCETPPGADGSLADSMVLAPLIVIGAIIVAPVYIADKGWELSQDGLKTHVYPAPGTTLGDFERAIDETEGKACLIQIESESDHVRHFKYRGKKAVYYGRFSSAGYAIKY